MQYQFDIPRPIPVVVTQFNVPYVIERDGPLVTLDRDFNTFFQHGLQCNLLTLDLIGDKGQWRDAKL